MNSMTVVGSSAIGFEEGDESDLLRSVLLNLVTDWKRQAPVESRLRLFLPRGWCGDPLDSRIRSAQNVKVSLVDCPQIPIPEIGANFLGKQLSEVDAVDHLPYPTAYASSWMQQKLKEWWENATRLETPFLLYLHTPDLLGIQLRKFRQKELIRRGYRIPMIATHHTGYLKYVDLQLRNCIRILLDNPNISIEQVFAKNGLFRVIMPVVDERGELLAKFKELFSGIRQAIDQLLIARLNESSPAAKKWGDVCMGIAGLFSKDVRHRIRGLQGISAAGKSSLAIANALGGIDVSKMPNVNLDFDLFLDELLRQSSLQLAQYYLKWFYDPCDKIITFESEAGVSELAELGLDEDKIIAIEDNKRLHKKVFSIYQQISASGQSSTPKRRQSISDLKFDEPPKGCRIGEGVLAMSDVHLGDGSGSSRAIAMLSLAPTLERLGIARIDIVGDLCERTAGQFRFQKHRKMFYNALCQVAELDNGRFNNAILSGKLKLDFDENKSGRSYETIRKELQRAAIRCSMSLDLEGEILGFDPVAAKQDVQVNIDRGNHDDGEDLEKIIPGAKETDSLIRYDENCGVVYVHGHIVGLPEYFEAISKPSSINELVEKLSEDKLKTSLETAAVAYGISSSLWRACQPIINFRSLYKEYLQQWLSGIGKWMGRVNEKSAQPNQNSEFVRFVSGIMSPIDNASDAVKLAAAIHGKDQWCWAICEGHSHQWSIEKLRVEHPHTGKMVSKFRINCGKFHGKRTTCVIIRFPDVVALEWDEKTEDWYVLQQVRLTDEEINEVLESGEVSEACMSTNRPINVSHSFDGSQKSNGTTLDEKQTEATIVEVPVEGGGHISRFKAMREIYEQHGSLYVLTSGSEKPDFADAQVTGYGINHDRFGNVRRTATFANYLRRRPKVKDDARLIADRLPRYSTAITDFGPTLVEAFKIARSRKLDGLPDLWHLSHQAALQDWQVNVPRPRKAEILNWLSGQSFLNSIVGDQSIGFHYERYNETIMTPLLGPDILSRSADFSDGYVLVYLRSKLPYLLDKLRQIDPNREIRWKVYTKHAINDPNPSRNIAVCKVGPQFRTDLLSAGGVFQVAGFMGTSESLHLGLPLVAMPIAHQYEQECNAAALSKIEEVLVVHSLEDREIQRQILSYFKERVTAGQSRLNRRGLMGPVGPFNDIRHEVADRIYGASVVAG